VTAPATPEAAAWEGWGTALKPAREPICLARKPLIGTVAANVLAHGTGALNIDGCRIHADDAQGGKYTVKRRKPGATLNKSGGNWRPEEGVEFHGEMKPGRWPANLIHDGSAEVVALFPQSDGQAGTVRGTEPSAPTKDIYGRFGGRVRSEARGDTGSAARFFNAFPPEGEPLRYCPKAAKADRAGSRHPTVKPIALMRWLCRLVTPPGGTILDPFAGSGTTGVAALAEGFAPILIERDANYAADLRRRFDLAANDADEIAQMLGFETDVASMLG
jgi:site-specific DNA-methyltransferase (adenine-specific)